MSKRIRDSEINNLISRLEYRAEIAQRDSVMSRTDDDYPESRYFAGKREGFRESARLLGELLDNVPHEAPVKGHSAKDRSSLARQMAAVESYYGPDR